MLLLLLFLIARNLQAFEVEIADPEQICVLPNTCVFGSQDVSKMALVDFLGGAENIKKVVIDVRTDKARDSLNEAAIRKMFASAVSADSNGAKWVNSPIALGTIHFKDGGTQSFAIQPSGISLAGKLFEVAPKAMKEPGVPARSSSTSNTTAGAPEKQVKLRDNKSPKLPNRDEILIAFIMYEEVAQEVWDAVGARLLAGDDTVFFEGSEGQVGFLRCDGPEKAAQPSEGYIMGGVIEGFISIIRNKSRVERVDLRPGRIGCGTRRTTIHLVEPDAQFPVGAGTPPAKPANKGPAKKPP